MYTQIKLNSSLDAHECDENVFREMCVSEYVLFPSNTLMWHTQLYYNIASDVAIKQLGYMVKIMNK